MKSNILFCGTRIPIIIAAIVQRKSTFLSSPAWLTRPWSDKGVPKTWGDRLTDAMTALPLILELYDLVDGGKSYEVQRQRQKHMQKLIDQCRETNEALQNWFACTREDAKPQILKTMRPLNDDYPFSYRYQFANHLFAQALVMYWTSCLILHSIIRDVNLLLLNPAGDPGWETDEQRAGNFDSNLGGDMKFGLTVTSDIEEGKAKLAALQPYINPRQHALSIAQSALYFLQPDMGALGGSYVKFPLGLSFSFFRGALQPGCRIPWRSDADTGIITPEKGQSEEDVSIVTWYNKIFDDMLRRGLPLGDFLTGSEGDDDSRETGRS